MRVKMGGHQERGQEKKKELPIIEAAELRRRLREVIHARTAIEFRLLPEVAAFFLQLDQETCGLDFSILIHSDGDGEGVSVLKAPDEGIARRAVRLWRDTPDRKMSGRFREEAYLSLYQIIQAGPKGVGSQVARQCGLYLDVLAELDAFQKLEGLAGVVGSGVGISEADLPHAQAGLQELWKKLNSGIQDRLDGFRPENVSSSIS